jgi:uncharacterized protein (UPF0261 family)
MTVRRAYAVTTSPRTAAAAGRAAAALAAAGEVALVDVSGDGQEFEAAVRLGRFAGVIDLALDGLAEALDGGPASDRLTAAAATGTPQVIVPGGCDHRSPRQVERLAKDVAQKASASPGPAVIVVPLAGWSDGRPPDPTAADVFVAALRLWLRPGIAVRECQMSMDDPALAERLAGELLRLTSTPARSC